MARRGTQRVPLGLLGGRAETTHGSSRLASIRKVVFVLLIDLIAKVNTVGMVVSSDAVLLLVMLMDGRVESER